MEHHHDDHNETCTPAVEAPSADDPPRSFAGVVFDDDQQLRILRAEITELLDLGFSEIDVLEALGPGSCDRPRSAATLLSHAARWGAARAHAIVALEAPPDMDGDDKLRVARRLSKARWLEAREAPSDRTLTAPEPVAYLEELAQLLGRATSHAHAHDLLEVRFDRLAERLGAPLG